VVGRGVIKNEYGLVLDKSAVAAGEGSDSNYFVVMAKQKSR
jgi:hypothetical protein